MARMVSGLRKQRLYSASASLPKKLRPCRVFASFFSMNQSGSAPIIFSGMSAGWMLKNLCHDRWLNGLPCIKSSGGPLPPCTVTMRAPEVLISARVKFSNTSSSSLNRNPGGLRQSDGDAGFLRDPRVEVRRLHDHLLDAQADQSFAHDPLLQSFGGP